MYFTCASCGSTRYEKREGQIFCAYCGAMYLVEDEQKPQRQKKSIWGIAVIVLLIVFILAGVIRPERDKENIQNNNIPQQPKSQSYIQIDNTNAQIGTQVVMIGSQNIQNSATSKSYAVSDTRTPSSPPKPEHDSEGIIHTTVKYQMPKIKVAKDAKVKIDNKNLNFTNQKIIKTKDRATGTITTTVLTGGFNDRQNRVYLDRKGVVSLLGSVTLFPKCCFPGKGIYFFTYQSMIICISWIFLLLKNRKFLQQSKVTISQISYFLPMNDIFISIVKKGSGFMIFPT